MAGRGSEIRYAVTFDDLAYAIDEISHSRRLRPNRFADCSSVRVVALACAVVTNNVDDSSVYW